MLPAVQFNGQFCFRAVKVQDVGSKQVLPAELGIAHLPVAEDMPQELLGIGGILAQSLAAREQDWVGRRHGVLIPLNPHPNPLPHKA